MLRGGAGVSALAPQTAGRASVLADGEEFSGVDSRSVVILRNLTVGRPGIVIKHQAQNYHFIFNGLRNEAKTQSS